MIQQRVIKLDGNTTGFAIWVFSKNDFIKGNTKKDENGNIVRDNNSVKLFKNIEAAKAFATSIGYPNPYQYKLWIFTGDTELDFNDVEYCETYYEGFSNNIHYFIEPDYVEKIIQIGYFVFNQYSSEKIDYKAGNKISRELIRYINKAMDRIVKYPNLEPATFDKIARDKYGHLCGYIKGTTGKIHVCTNSQIMDINMSRKDKDLRCIPYEKCMDKFTSIYVYCTKDLSDTVRNIENAGQELIDLILEILINTYPELNPRFVPVQIKGLITD